MTNHLSQTRYLPLPFPPPPRSTPTPVPTTKTFVSIAVSVVPFLFLLYCSPYIVVLDWFVSYAFTSVGKLHCNISSQTNHLNLKNWDLLLWWIRVFDSILIFSSWVRMTDVLGDVALKKEEFKVCRFGKGNKCLLRKVHRLKLVKKKKMLDQLYCTTHILLFCKPSLNITKTFNSPLMPEHVW